MAPQAKGPVVPAPVLLRAWHLRSWGRRRFRRRRLLLLAQRVEHPTAALPRRSAGRLLCRAAGVLDDGMRLTLPPSQEREQQARGKEGCGQDGSRAGQHIGGPPARLKSAGRPASPPTPLTLF